MARSAWKSSPGVVRSRILRLLVVAAPLFWAAAHEVAHRWDAARDVSAGPYLDAHPTPADSKGSS
jgi:hypothetical protein